MRVAVGGVWYETNTFTPGMTRLEAFEVYAGGAMLDAFGGTRTPIGGSLAGARQTGLTVVPTVFAWAVPSGIVARSAYEALAGRFVEAVVAAHPDGILLDLHGAMVAEGYDDVEGDLVSRLRARIGDTPIGAVLDFHANTTETFVEGVDLVAGYDTYPHVDPYKRGVEVPDSSPGACAARLRPSGRGATRRCSSCHRRRRPIGCRCGT